MSADRDASDANSRRRRRRRRRSRHRCRRRRGRQTSASRNASVWERARARGSVIAFSSKRVRKQKKLRCAMTSGDDSHWITERFLRSRNRARALEGVKPQATPAATRGGDSRRVRAPTRMFERAGGERRSIAAAAAITDVACCPALRIQRCHRLLARLLACSRAT